MLRFLGLLSTAGLAVTNGAIIPASYRGRSGLQDHAVASGKYMGTATNLMPSDTYYTQMLKNGHEFGMITPANAMKVSKEHSL